jgi:hypothetical protein
MPECRLHRGGIAEVPDLRESRIRVDEHSHWYVEKPFAQRIDARNVQANVGGATDLQRPARGRPEPSLRMRIVVRPALAQTRARKCRPRERDSERRIGNLLSLDGIVTGFEIVTIFEEIDVVAESLEA